MKNEEKIELNGMALAWFDPSSEDMHTCKGISCCFQFIIIIISIKALTFQVAFMKAGNKTRIKIKIQHKMKQEKHWKNEKIQQIAFDCIWSVQNVGILYDDQSS